MSQPKSFDITWGTFALIEFLVAFSDDLGSRFRTCLDIGSGAGRHSEIFRHAGLEVFQLDKYSETAEYKVDFLRHDFDRKFDLIFCSHVIEHQRNVGLFLDKIHDLLSDDGILILSAPKHRAERLVEGHLNCFFTTYFVQHLIHAGFDLKRGRYLSCAGFENSAIVPKADNFRLEERQEDGYHWTAAHQARSFFPLQTGEIDNEVAFFHNCIVIESSDDASINIRMPQEYVLKGIEIKADKLGFSALI